MAASFGRILCATGIHRWEQRDDPRGYSGGPLVVYKFCRRCEKQQWDDVTPVRRPDRHLGNGLGGFRD